MPQAGEIKWMSSSMTTIEDVEMEINRSLTEQAWVDLILGAAGGVDTAPMFMNLLVYVCQVQSDYYYSTYQDGLIALKGKIASLDENVPFKIKQKYRWHAGQRSWQPLNEFSIEEIKN